MLRIICGFRGSIYDAKTGLHYNWHRYYDPETGRYITADPIGLEGGINLYGYCLNDPVNLVDPTGEFGFIIPAIIFISETLGIGGGTAAVGTGISALTATEVLASTGAIIAAAGAVNFMSNSNRANKIRGAKGGIKHQPGRGHDGKSAEQKQKRFQKKQAKKCQEAQETSQLLEDEWNSMSEQARKIYGSIENFVKMKR